MISQSVGEYIFPPLANIVESYANDVYILTQVIPDAEPDNIITTSVYGSYEALINEIDNKLDTFRDVSLSPDYQVYADLKEELIRDPDYFLKYDKIAHRFDTITLNVTHATVKAISNIVYVFVTLDYNAKTYGSVSASVETSLQDIINDVNDTLDDCRVNEMEDTPFCDAFMELSDDIREEGNDFMEEDNEHMVGLGSEYVIQITRTQIVY